MTGAASGIGLALAQRLANEGMDLAIADIEGGALVAAEAELRGTGVRVLAVQLDVADEASVEGFAASALGAFGPPALLCNNAGVGGGWSPIWTATRKDWDWMLGVNLMGVVHGIRAFLPAMIEGGEEGHVVNTSSVAGLMTGPGQVYGVSKHAVTRLTEGLWYDLEAIGSRIGVSVLCPGIAATRINTAARNRPSHSFDEGRSIDENRALFEAMEERYLATGMPPAEVADILLGAVREGRFYVFTHDWVLGSIERRTAAILDGMQPPTLPGPAPEPGSGPVQAAPTSPTPGA